ncbi:MAG: MarR family transcriptional regulator [archaeon]
MAKFLDLSNKQTYKIVLFILNSSKDFKLMDLVSASGVSKAWASKVLKRLLEKGFVSRANNSFSLRKPLDLVSLFPLFRSMNNNLVQSFNVLADRKKLLLFLKKKKVVLCGTTALQYYSSYFRDSSINFYLRDKSVLSELKELENGLLKVNVYKPDLSLDLDIVKKEGFLLTSKVRTIIDLFCDNKAHAVEKLINQLW